MVQEEQELGQHVSPVEETPAWPGMAAEASHGGSVLAEAKRETANDSASWQADRVSLQHALDRAMAQQIDPSQRPTWTATPEGTGLNMFTMPVPETLLQGITPAMACLKFLCATQKASAPVPAGGGSHCYLPQQHIMVCSSCSGQEAAPLPLHILTAQLTNRRSDAHRLQCVESPHEGVGPAQHAH